MPQLQASPDPVKDRGRSELRSILDRPFPDAKVLAVDLETTGLSPRDDSIVTIAVSDGNDAIVYDMRKVLPYGKCDEEDSDSYCTLCVYDWLNDHIFDRKLILHNAAFDLMFLREKYYVKYPEHVWDTMLAEQLITAGYDDLQVNLKDTAKRWLGLDLDKSLQTSFTLDGEITPEQIDYATYDVIPLIELAKLQQNQLNAEGLGRVWEIERRALPVFAEMIRCGVKVDLEMLRPLLDEAIDRRDALLEDLQTKLTPHVMWLRIAKRDLMQEELDLWKERYDAEVARLEREWVLFGGEYAAEEWEKPNEFSQNKWDDLTVDKSDGKIKGQKRYVKAKIKDWRQTPEGKRPLPPKIDESPINLNSPPQVKAALGQLGVDLPDLQAKTVQAALVDIDPVVRDEVIVPLLRYKKDEKLISSFGERLIAKIDDTGRVHGNFRQIGTATGRPSCSDPNLLQMPSDDKKAPPEKRFRRVFRADEDKLMIVCDYSQMELRILAQMSRDPRMQEAFKEGFDLHTYTASLMFGVDFDAVSDKQRKTAKTLNFGICYGMGPTKLRATLAAEGIYYTAQEARQALDDWKHSYPAAAAWLNKQQNLAVQQGWTATPLGRRRHFRIEDLKDAGERGMVKRRGANHVIQGANADITKLAMVLIHENLNGRGNIVLNVYDEIVTEVDMEVAEGALDLVRESMEMAARTVLSDIPVAVDAVISKSWSEGEVVEIDSYSATTRV